MKEMANDLERLLGGSQCRSIAEGTGLRKVEEDMPSVVEDICGYNGDVEKSAI